MDAQDEFDDTRLMKIADDLLSLGDDPDAAQVMKLIGGLTRDEVQWLAEESARRAEIASKQAEKFKKLAGPQDASK